SPPNMVPVRVPWFVPPACARMLSAPLLKSSMMIEAASTTPVTNNARSRPVLIATMSRRDDLFMHFLLVVNSYRDYAGQGRMDGVGAGGAKRSVPHQHHPSLFNCL